MDIPSPLTPKAALDIIEHIAKTLPGFRRAHARGLATRGHFIATPEAKRLTTAAHFQGAEVPCVVRFSNAAANPCVPDTGSPTEGTVLGLAIRFALPNDGVAAWAAINLTAFVASTPEEFLKLGVAQRPGPSGKPNLLKLGWHVLTHLHIVPGVQSAKSLEPSQSFASETYAGLHTYFFVDEAGARHPFRYRWMPRETLPPLSPVLMGLSSCSMRAVSRNCCSSRARRAWARARAL